MKLHSYATNTAGRPALHRAGALLALLFTLIATGCEPTAVARAPIKSQATEKAIMRIECFGRYQVTVPAGSVFSVPSVTLPNVEFRTQREGAATLDAFQGKLKAFAQKLGNSPHDTEKSLLHRVEALGPDAAVIVFRESAAATEVFEIQGWRWLAPGVEYIAAGAATTAEVTADTPLFAQAAQNLRFRAPGTVPQSPGLCLQDAWLPGGAHRRESVSARLTLPAQGVTITLATELPVPKTRDDQLLARWNAAKRVSAPLPKFEELRNGTRMVDGRPAEELVLLANNDRGVPTLDAKLEAYGDRTPQRPTLRISMTVEQLDAAPGAGINQPLSRKAALELWDGLTQSIRQRAGAF